MTEFEDKDEVEIWGFICKLTNTQINDFRRFAKNSDLHKRMYSLDFEMGAAQRACDMKAVKEIADKMRVIDLEMFEAAEKWYHQTNGIPEGM